MCAALGHGSRSNYHDLIDFSPLCYALRFFHFLELRRLGFFFNLLSLSFFPLLYRLSVTPGLYLSNPITVNIVTAQISVLQKRPEPEPMAYLLGAYWFSEGAGRPSERSGKETGNQFAQRFWFQPAPWATCTSAIQGQLLSRYTQGSRQSKRQKWDASELLEPENRLKNSLSGRAPSGWLFAFSAF